MAPTPEDTPSYDGTPMREIVAAMAAQTVEVSVERWISTADRLDALEAAILRLAATLQPPAPATTDDVPTRPSPQHEMVCRERHRRTQARK
jgi:hypothetical protein